MRAPLMLAAAASLVAALWGGVVRSHGPLPWPPERWIALHGPLMVSGFLGTLIGLERAVGLGRPWAYAGPVLTAMGAVLSLAGAGGRLAALCAAAGSAGLVAVFAALLSRQATLFHATMGLGAAAWLFGNLLLLAGRAVPDLAVWWMAFFVLTVAGERLELTRLLPPSPARRAVFLACVAALLAGALGTLASPAAGYRLTGLGLLGLALWLWTCDVARRTAARPGLPRFTALCLLAGYAWLAAAGILALVRPPVGYGLEYDALLHAVFVGFVVSMVFGHAPVILPAVLGIDLPYRPAFYGHLVLLHASLALRVAADLMGWHVLRAWGGTLNAAAFGLFLLASAGSAIAARRRA